MSVYIITKRPDAPAREPRMFWWEPKRSAPAGWSAQLEGCARFDTIAGALAGAWIHCWTEAEFADSAVVKLSDVPALLEADAAGRLHREHAATDRERAEKAERARDEALGELRAAQKDQREILERVRRQNEDLENIERALPDLPAAAHGLSVRTRVLALRQDAERAMKERDEALVSSGDTIIMAERQAEAWRARIEEVAKERDEALRDRSLLLRGLAGRHGHPCPECYEFVPCLAPAQVIDGEMMRDDGRVVPRIVVDGCSLEPDMTLEDGRLSGSHVVCEACKARAPLVERVAALTKERDKAYEENAKLRHALTVAEQAANELLGAKAACTRAQVQREVSDDQRNAALGALAAVTKERDELRERAQMGDGWLPRHEMKRMQDIVSEWVSIGKEAEERCAAAEAALTAERAHSDALASALAETNAILVDVGALAGDARPRLVDARNLSLIATHAARKKDR